MRTASALLIVPLFLVGTLAGCVSDSAPTADNPRSIRGDSPAAGPGSDEIRLQAGQTVKVSLDGTGWGRLVIRAQSKLTINVTLENPSFNLQADRSKADPTGVYDEHNHTHLYLYPEDEVPGMILNKGWWFHWWGIHKSPFAQTSPYGSAQIREFQGLSVAAGSGAALLASTTVPGYSLTLTTGLEQGVTSKVLRLGERDGHTLFVPKVKETSMASNQPARIQRDRDWSTGMVKLAAETMVLGFYWDSKEGNVRYAGASTDEVGIVNDRPSTPPRPSPDSGGGAATGSSNTIRRLISQPGDYEMYRHVVENHVGTYDTSNMGIVFLTLPIK